MASTTAYKQTSELPIATTSTRDCGIPGCFTCANGEEHPPMLTASDEFLMKMNTHREALCRAMEDIEARYQTLHSESNVEDLESGNDELRDLGIAHRDFVNALESVGHYIVKRGAMSGVGSDHEEKEEEMDDEEGSDSEFEFAERERQEYVLDHLDSEYEPSHANLLASKLAALLINAEAEEEKVEEVAKPIQI